MADKYGRYTIIHEVEKSNGMRRALCRCDCGTNRSPANPGQPANPDVGVNAGIEGGQ